MDERHAYWLAALIDGEGSIIIRTKPGRNRPFICITIAQNDRRLLDRAVEWVGCGAIYAGQGPRKNGHQMQIFRRADVERILLAVEPHLIVKRDRAQAALAALAIPRPVQPRDAAGRMMKVSAG
jgi:hypothetical protein